MHLGVILPNFGTASSPDRIRNVAETAEELGFDSVWTTQHIVVGAEAVEHYGRAHLARPGRRDARGRRRGRRRHLRGRGADAEFVRQYR